MFDRRSREWVHGLLALILGLFLLGGGANLGISKTAVDLLGGMLAIPEYPAVVLRDAIQDWMGWLLSRATLQEEIARLKDENAKLRMARAEAVNELIRLENMTEEAKVTLRVPMSWWSEARIDRGEQDNVSAGAPVLHGGYLAGRVSSVSRMSSWVELITSTSLMIPVVIEETRELGVVVGDGEGVVQLKYISAGRGAAVGMNVSTALIGEQFPPGIPVGKIAEELSLSPDGYITYRIEPGANFSKLYAVSLLLPSNPYNSDKSEKSGGR